MATSSCSAGTRILRARAIMCRSPSSTIRQKTRGSWPRNTIPRSEEHTSELQSLMRISYAVFCLKKKKNTQKKQITQYSTLATKRQKKTTTQQKNKHTQNH